MSFQNDINSLERAFDALKQQSASTSDNWDGPVKNRYYEQFVNSLPNEVRAYLKELSKLDKSFENAERTIESLH